MRIRIPLLTLALAALAVLPAYTQPAAPSVAGDWEGVLRPMGGSLRFVLHVTQVAPDSLAATADSPDQNAFGIPVTSISTEGDRLTFAITPINGRYAGTLDADRTTLTGTWSQNGGDIALDLKRKAAPDATPPETGSPR